MQCTHYSTRLETCFSPQLHKLLGQVGPTNQNQCPLFLKHDSDNSLVWAFSSPLCYSCYFYYFCHKGEEKEKIPPIVLTCRKLTFPCFPDTDLIGKARINPTCPVKRGLQPLGAVHPPTLFQQSLKMVPPTSIPKPLDEHLWVSFVVQSRLNLSAGIAKLREEK